jgi:hypothetical protein
MKMARRKHKQAPKTETETENSDPRSGESAKTKDNSPCSPVFCLLLVAATIRYSVFR